MREGGGMVNRRDQLLADFKYLIYAFYFLLETKGVSIQVLAGDCHPVRRTPEYLQGCISSSPANVTVVTRGSNKPLAEISLFYSSFQAHQITLENESR